MSVELVFGPVSQRTNSYLRSYQPSSLTINIHLLLHWLKIKVWKPVDSHWSCGCNKNTSRVHCSALRLLSCSAVQAACIVNTPPVLHRFALETTGTFGVFPLATPGCGISCGGLCALERASASACSCGTTNSCVSTMASRCWASLTTTMHICCSFSDILCAFFLSFLLTTPGTKGKCPSFDLFGTILLSQVWPCWWWPFCSPARCNAAPFTFDIRNLCNECRK